MPLTDDARRRLRAIQEFSDLGAGFRIAAKDLEIRGAGNVLGGQQSGHIDAVGFETYVTLLEEAIGELKGEPVAEKREVTLQLGLPLGLPKKWIGEESLRMALYKRLATADGVDALDLLAREASDRYGTPPPEFARLLGLSRLRLLALDLGVRSIQRRGAELAVTLEKGHRLDPDRFLSALKAKVLAASGPEAFRAPELFRGLPPDTEEVCSVAGRLLASLARPTALTAPGLLSAFSGGPS
jgi:transcription-repair coupling factor (superfamily II helicase)